MKRIILPFLASILFCACTENDELSCDEKVCTMQFESVNVKFIDSNGSPLIVKDYQSSNLRTGKFLSVTTAVDTIRAKGFYTVASDVNLKELNTSDKILVSSKHPVTNVLKQAEFTISGGECACHVGKIAGPDTIRF